ncbi:hypothetical protein DPMN_054601 [Dreissena polymorpha]|uniref:Uncharacterized protein n=1 Tax=Dreissena polymorpha TaxID=45954 RepID=A0A9D4CP76_DREPO|nr:hypothetical protein DPMN_054601 [Dreissena polymorpha]
MQETPIHSTTCQDRLGNFRRLPDSLLQCPTVSHSVENCLGISYMCPHGLRTIADCLGVSCRYLDGVRDCLTQSGSLLQVPGRSWHRRRLSGILLLVPRRYIVWHRVCVSWQSVILLQVPRRS